MCSAAAVSTQDMHIVGPSDGFQMLVWNGSSVPRDNVASFLSFAHCGCRDEVDAWVGWGGEIAEEIDKRHDDVWNHRETERSITVPLELVAGISGQGVGCEKNL